MPTYVIGCSDGHEVEHRVSFSKFDSLKAAVEEMVCPVPVSELSNCELPLQIKTQPTPFSFFRGDSEFEFSMKTFGVGNLGEI